MIKSTLSAAFRQMAVEKRCNVFSLEHKLLNGSLLIKPRRAPWLTQVDRRDNTLVLKSERDKGEVVLNEIATSIWELCDGETPLANILTEFTKLSDQQENASRAVSTMMLALQSQGLLYLGNEDDYVV